MYLSVSDVYFLLSDFLNRCVKALFQIIGWNRISIGNSSSLPASISKIRTYLANGEKKLKFCVGPTNSRPGPILLIQAATAVKFVVKSFWSKEIAKMETEHSRHKVTR